MLALIFTLPWTKKNHREYTSHSGWSKVAPNTDKSFFKNVLPDASETHSALAGMLPLSCHWQRSTEQFFIFIIFIRSTEQLTSFTSGHLHPAQRIILPESCPFTVWFHWPSGMHYCYQCYWLQRWAVRTSCMHINILEGTSFLKMVLGIDMHTPKAFQPWAILSFGWDIKLLHVVLQEFPPWPRTEDGDE